MLLLEIFRIRTTKLQKLPPESLHPSGRRDNRHEISQRDEQLHLLHRYTTKMEYSFRFQFVSRQDNNTNSFNRNNQTQLETIRFDDNFSSNDSLSRYCWYKFNHTRSRHRLEIPACKYARNVNLQQRLDNWNRSKNFHDHDRDRLESLNRKST